MYRALPFFGLVHAHKWTSSAHGWTQSCTSYSLLSSCTLMDGDIKRRIIIDHMTHEYPRNAINPEYLKFQTSYTRL